MLEAFKLCVHFSITDNKLRIVRHHIIVTGYAQILVYSPDDFYRFRIEYVALPGE
jgi:hypothetical protein